MLDSLPVNFLFRLSAIVDTPVSIAGGPQGDRMIVAAADGRFDGPELSGRIVPGPGAEWATVRADGSVKADVRLLLQTDDGAPILMTYQGIAIADGESLKVTIAPLFETGHEKYAWLNKVQAIGLGTPTETGIDYDIYQIL